MTREEKISHLKDILSEINENDNAVCYLTSEDNELIESAIKALELETCEDAISRAEALKALDYDIKSFEFKSGVSRHMNEIANLLNTIYEIQSDNIKALPPVQPKIKSGHWIHRSTDDYLGITTWYECSECGRTVEDIYHVYGEYPYCHCGAKMINVPDKNDGKIKESEDKT